MEKKSMVIAMLLAFFLACGGFYVAGLKKGALLFIGTSLLAFVLVQISPSIVILANLVGCFVTYKWLQEYNSGAEAA